MTNTKIVYIVDDDEDDRMLLKESVTNIIPDSQIREAYDGADLIDQISISSINSLDGDIVILMDMNMPRMNGLEALTALRSVPDLTHIPVIMISTASNPDLVKKAYNQGINAYIVKPYLLKEYEELARAVAVCFFNNYPTFESDVAIKSTSPKTILVIEDDADQRQLIDLALKRCLTNIDVLSISNPVSAFEHIQHNWQQNIIQPDLILLDLYLPERKIGLSTLKKMKEFLTNKNLAIPIIVLSHSNDPNDIKDCYRYQANAFMSKKSDINLWFSFFSYLCHFWMDTIITYKEV